IEVLALLDRSVAERRAGLDLVPTHVRHLEPGAVGEAHHTPAQEAQARARPLLLTLVEQDLQAQADAEIRPAGQNVGPHGLAEAAGEPAHAIAEGTLARYHQPRGGRHALGIRGQNRHAAGSGQRLLDAAQVAASGVDDRDHAYRVSVPLVDGTSVRRGSRRTAAAHGRASALNRASMMWCAFSP